MAACRSTNPKSSDSSLQAYELECKRNVEPDICMCKRDWKAHLLVEYSKNKFVCELLDGLIHDDRYKVEDEIIFYEDQIYFVPRSTLRKRLLRTTHNRPAEITLESYPQSRHCTNMEQTFCKSRSQTDDKDHKENLIAAVDSPEVHESLVKVGSTRHIGCKKHRKKHGKGCVATEMVSSIVITVGNAKFYLDKFPILCNSCSLQNLVAKIVDFPGGSHALELCAKFCYGIDIALNAYNVDAICCAANYLGITKAVEKENLVPKNKLFFISSLIQSWKNLIIVLQTAKTFLPWIVLDSIASKASIDPPKID